MDVCNLSRGLNLDSIQDCEVQKVAHLRYRVCSLLKLLPSLQIRKEVLCKVSKTLARVLCFTLTNMSLQDPLYLEGRYFLSVKITTARRYDKI